MCGIAGIIQSRSDPEDTFEALQRMLRAMLHRGPDDVGTAHLAPDSLFGMRRLAIFDPANGRQPMRTRGGRFSLIFNGAIYNHRALREELEKRGHCFRTHCDTEVLLEAWACWREAALDRLRGMFAIAVWEHPTRTLWLARDPLGIKPLYAHERDGGLLFASELNALLASGLVPTEIDPMGLHAYLARLGVPAPQTVYRGTVSLRPGELLRWQDGRTTLRQFWSLPHLQSTARTSDAKAFTGELRQRLADTVKAHQLADVPVGAFLSGGLDSAVITGLMSGLSSTPLKTFSIGFPEAEFSEASAAAETAAHFGTDHHEIMLTGEDAAAAVPDFIAALDQPTGDGFNTFLVSRAAKAGGVTAALSGLGGDELFGGYPSFREVPLLARGLPWWFALPESLRGWICGQLERRGPAKSKLASVLRHARDIHAVADLRREVLTPELCRQVLAPPGGLAELTAYQHPLVEELRQEMTGAAPVEVVSAWELRGYMVDVLLRDSDVFSMRASLELRVPFVDRPLIEWLWQQPANLRLSTDGTKSPLVAATRDLLPPGLLDRRKRGFTLPFPHWMRGSLRPFIEDTLASGPGRLPPWLNRSEIERQWRQFRDGEDDKQWSRVWSLVVLVAFLNRKVAS